MNIGGKEIQLIILDDIEWVTAQDAAWILTVANGRESNPISVDYPRRLASQLYKMIESRKLNNNMSVYRMDQLVNRVVRVGPGRHPRMK